MSVRLVVLSSARAAHIMNAPSIHRALETHGAVFFTAELKMSLARCVTVRTRALDFPM